MSVASLCHSPSLLRQLAVDLEKKYLKDTELNGGVPEQFKPIVVAPTGQTFTLTPIGADVFYTRNESNMVLLTIRGGRMTIETPIGYTGGAGFTINMAYALGSIGSLKYKPNSIVYSSSRVYLYGNSGYVGVANWFFRPDGIWGADIYFPAYQGLNLPPQQNFIIEAPPQISYITNDL